MLSAQEGLQTLVGESPAEMEADLEASYPNPFNGRLVIPYQVAQEGLVTLRVYNASSGQRVRERFRGQRKGALSRDLGWPERRWSINCQRSVLVGVARGWCSGAANGDVDPLTERNDGRALSTNTLPISSMLNYMRFAQARR